MTYNQKHNEANGEDNNDGSSDNRSWNCGAEGDTADPKIIAMRNKQMRNFMATLLLSQGTPMIVAGDEFGRTQGGNNNAYCQDSEIGWVDWNLSEDGKVLLDFTRKLGELRHRYPVLRRNRFYTGKFDEVHGVKDIAWIKSDGFEAEQQDWTDNAMRCVGMLMDGRAQINSVPQDGEHATMMLVVNAGRDSIAFTVPECVDGTGWTRVLDTSNATKPDQNFSDRGDVSHPVAVLGPAPVEHAATRADPGHERARPGSASDHLTSGPRICDVASASTMRGSSPPKGPSPASEPMPGSSPASAADRNPASPCHLGALSIEDQP